MLTFVVNDVIILHVFFNQDLKKYKFYYWFAFPALCPETSATHVAPPVHLGDYFTPSQVRTNVQFACFFGC